MSYSDFDSELTDLSNSESDYTDDEPLASKYKASTKKSNKGRETQLQNTLRPPRIIQLSTKALYDQIVDGSIDLDPEYQRDVVWPESKQSGLIDSILHNYYVPPIIFAVQANNDQERRTCIDGKQRLTSIQRFLDGLIPHKDSFTGQKLWYKSTSSNSQKLLKDLHKKSFVNKQMVCVEYENITPDQEREIFQRVQLGVPLTPAERMQAITGPWPSFIREIQREILGQDGFEGYLDWGHARGRDFQCLASIAYLASKYPNLSHPAAPALERWLQEQKEVSSLLHTRLLSTFRIFVNLARDDKFRGPLNHPTRVSPVEFVMIGLLIFVHSRSLSMTQLSSAIERLRADVRASYLDIRLNTRILGHMFKFVCKQVIRSTLKSDKKGDVPAATSQMPSKTTKRKRVIESSDEEVEEVQPPKSAKGKTKSTAKETAAPAKRKVKIEPTSDKDVKPTKPSIAQPSRPVPKPVNTASSVAQKASVVKPPTPSSRRNPGLPSAPIPKKKADVGEKSVPATTTATPAKSEKTEPAVSSQKQPVPVPPNRKFGKKTPSSTNTTPSSTQTPPVVPPPKAPIAVPTAPPPALAPAPPPAPAPAPPPAPTAPPPASPPEILPIPSPILTSEPPNLRPIAPQPPPIQTDVIVKTEPPPSPSASLTSPTFMHLSNKTGRLAALRAARAAVGGTKLEMPSPTLASPQSQPSPTLAQIDPTSQLTRDPRRRLTQSASQLPSPVATAGSKGVLGSIEDLLVRANSQTSDLVSPTGSTPIIPLASPALSFLASGNTANANPQLNNAQTNGPATSGPNGFPRLANHAGFPTPFVNGGTSAISSPQVPATTFPIPIAPRALRDSGPTQQSHTSTKSTPISDSFIHPKSQPLSPDLSRFPAPSDSSLSDIRHHTLPTRPHSPSASGSVSGSTRDYFRDRYRDRSRSRSYERSRDRSPDPRYGRSERGRSYKRNSREYYRDREYKDYVEYKDRERSRYRGRDSGERSYDWDRDRDRYGDRDRERDSRGYRRDS